MRLASQVYPLPWKEQGLLFPLLPPHLQPMALFIVHTGLRDEECCALRWAREREEEEFGASVLVIPKEVAKNGEESVVVLNRVARAVLEAQRGKHGEFVFVYQRPAPAGFKTLHVHDLGHTFGRRLRAAGVPIETRKALLGRI